MNSIEKPQGYFPYIDGLRAIAVLSVFLYHIDPSWLPGGFTGVDVFFVISGFVISGSLDNRGLRTFGEFVSYFYSRRIKRIMPALIACVIVSAVAFVLFSIQGAAKPTDIRDTALSALFGFSNIVLYSSEQNYFSSSAEMNPFTHTWSLGVEEQFYLLFPFLFFWWARDGATVKARTLSATLFGLGLVVSIVLGVTSSAGSDGFGFYMLPARFWELACGVLIYQLHASHNGTQILGSIWIKTLAPISIALIVLGFVLSDKANFPVPWAIPPVLGTAGLIAALLYPGSFAGSGTIKNILASRPMVYIGQRSYSMYLWHWPVLVMFRWTIGLEEPLFKLLAILLTLSLTILSFNFVERPVRSSEYLRVRSNRFALVGGLAITALMLSTTAGVFRFQNRLSLSVTVKDKIWYPRNRQIISDPVCGSRSVFLPFSQSNTQKQYRQLESKCSADAKRSLFVIGDSHAWHYIPMFSTLAANQPIDVNLFSSGGCRFPEATVFPDRYSELCQNMARLSRKEVLAIAKPGDVLFIPGKRVKGLKALTEDFTKGVIPEARLRAELQPFLDRGMNVLLEMLKPVFPARADHCADWFNRPNPQCDSGLSVPKAQIQDRGRAFTSIYSELAKAKRIHLWQPMTLLCPDDVCEALADGQPLFFDENHLSWHGNRVLYAEFEALIEAIVGAPH